MDNVVQVEKRSVYGKEQMYPVNRLGHALADFKGNKTLTSSDVAFLTQMGFKVRLVAVFSGEVVEIGPL